MSGLMPIVNGISVALALIVIPACLLLARSAWVLRKVIRWEASHEADSPEAHVTPTPAPREHNTRGLPCWCRPQVYRVCGECDGRTPGCWRCGGEGKYPADVRETLYGDEPLIVVHNEN